MSNARLLFFPLLLMGNFGDCTSKGGEENPDTALPDDVIACDPDSAPFSEDYPQAGVEFTPDPSCKAVTGLPENLSLVFDHFDGRFVGSSSAVELISVTPGTTQVIDESTTAISDLPDNTDIAVELRQDGVHLRISVRLEPPVGDALPVLKATSIQRLDD